MKEIKVVEKDSMPQMHKEPWPKLTPTTTDVGGARVTAISVCTPFVFEQDK